MNYELLNTSFYDFILNIKKYFNDEKNKILFNQRNIIKLISYKEKKYVIKSFKIPHLLNKLVYKFIRASKAKRSYLNSIKLIELNINTPKPIGYVEYSSILLFKDSYYISEFFPYDFEIRDVLSSNKFENRNIILDRFVEFSYDLHNKGVYHIDYSPGNVLIKKEDNEYIYSIIDVNRMKFINFTNKLRMKNLSRFSTSKDDLEYISKKYAEISSINENFCIKYLNKYHNEHQQYLINKKKLKSFI